MAGSCWSLVGSGPSVDLSGEVTGREGSRESGHTASLHMQQHSLKTEAQWSSSAAGYSQVEISTRHSTTTPHNQGLKHKHPTQLQTQPDTQPSPKTSNTTNPQNHTQKTRRTQ